MPLRLRPTNMIIRLTGHDQACTVSRHDMWQLVILESEPLIDTPHTWIQFVYDPGQPNG
jgi:hypothetical protein